jgi:hypothetical protein
VKPHHAPAQDSSFKSTQPWPALLVLSVEMEASLMSMLLQAFINSEDEHGMVYALSFALSGNTVGDASLSRAKHKRPLENLQWYALEL